MFSLRNLLQNDYGNQLVKFKQHCFLFRKLILYLRQFIEILKKLYFNYYANLLCKWLILIIIFLIVSFLSNINSTIADVAQLARAADL